MNEETHPSEPSARRVTLRLRLQRTLDRDGPDAAVAEFERMRAAFPTSTSPSRA